MLPYNKDLKPIARTLRKSMTAAEQLLWSKLRRKQLKGYQFYRQKALDNYVVDFYCPSAKLVVELDGGQHYTENGKKKDSHRDRRLQSLNLKVLHIADSEVFKNTNVVLEEIWNNL